MPDKGVGLRQKYIVYKRESLGSTGWSEEPITAQVFVLKPDTDPIAKVALRAYAEEAARQGYEPLAEDLFNWLREL